MINIRDPHTVAWIILGIIVGLFIFGLFQDLLVEMMVVSALFVLFYFIDRRIFDVRGKSVVTIFSGHLFTKRWQAFPIFLLEIFSFAWVSTMLQDWLTNEASTQKIEPVYVIVWLILLFIFYWFRGSRK